MSFYFTGKSPTGAGRYAPSRRRFESNPIDFYKVKPDRENIERMAKAADHTLRKNGDTDSGIVARRVGGFRQNNSPVNANAMIGRQQNFDNENFARNNGVDVALLREPRPAPGIAMRKLSQVAALRGRRQGAVRRSHGRKAARLRLFARDGGPEATTTSSHGRLRRRHRR